MFPPSGWSSTGCWWGGTGTSSAEREGTGPGVAPREGLRGQTGPSTAPAPVKMAAPMRNMAAPMGENGPQAPPPSWDWLAEAGKSRSFPERAQCEERERSLGSYERAAGKSRSVPERAEGPRSSSFSGRTRRAPENAETGSKRRNESICFRRSRSALGPARAFPESPQRPRTAPSGDPRGPPPPPFRRSPKRFRRLRKRLQSGACEPRGRSATPRNGSDAVPEVARRLRSLLRGSEILRKFPKRFQRPTKRPRRLPSVSEAAPESPEPPPHFRRSPKRLRKVSSSSEPP